MYYHNFYATNPFKPKSVEFDVWSTLDIKKLSVAKIHSHVSFDGLGYPISGGLYDSRLGPLKFTSDPCATCGHNLMKCSGHYGHIELPFPVYNPLFIAIVANILQISCCSCYTIIIPESEKYVLITQLKLVEAGYFVQAMELDQYLEEYSYKQPCQIQKDMIAICKKILPSAASDNLCKNTEQLWKHYIQKIFNFRTMKTCINCKTQLLKFVFKEGRLCTPSMKGDTNKIYLTPLIAKEHLRKLWLNEKEFLKSLIKVLSVTNEEHPTDICFTSAIIVTPSNTRPVQIVNQKQIEHPKSGMYRQILQDSLLIRSILQVIEVEKTNKTVDENIIDLVNASRGQTINEKLNNAWFSLQRNVDALLDANALNGIINQSLGISKIGLKQLIEKKAGILRNNMMGKRVDYFARSVITPDPLLNICEIGVPDTFAKKLTFPVPVTPWNVTDLRKMVLNGPNVYPGANIVEGGDGSITWISGTNEKNRKNLAKTLLTPTLDSSGPKVVHRHLLNNDMLLLNRQPSLHKPSMMAHRARILKGEKTFRLHYANCKAYNADFDGDEMNAHFPQGEIARAEASEIMNVAHQYLVPRDGTPLSGLIQDHIISGFQLSTRDKFFKRWQYHQLVFQALSFLNDDFKLLPPAILKPKQLWTGKQIISTVIINLISKGMVPLNLNSTTKLRYNSWPICNKKYDYMTQKEREDMSEINVIIRKGELLCGVLDKNHIGASHYSLVHSFYELYGGQHSSNLLSAFSKLFTFYLQKNGFTLSVADILVQKKRDNKRKNIMAQVDLAGIVAAKNALDIPLKCDTNEEDLRRLLEIAYKKNSNFSGLIDREFKIILDEYTNEINKVCLPEGLLQLFPNNNLQLMVQSGAKGSIVNTMQISCLLGQIELEGKRPPLMISGKSLPSFRPYDVSPMAGGFIVSRFMTGIKPQEFFFHCMAGREGLIDTAVKTSRSGYLQRCLVKHLEGLIVNYDLTVRDSDNSVIQFLYGEDGLDISKSQLLEAEQLKFFVDNIDSLYDKHNIEILKNKNSKHIIKNRKSEISTWFSKNKFTSVESRRNGAFLYFCRDVADDMPRITLTKAIPGRTLEATQLCHIWQNLLHKNAKRKYSEMFSNCPDPVAAYYSQDRYFGSVSENTENIIENYIKLSKQDLSIKKLKLKNAVYWKSFSSLCQPGEAVGVLAAQSVGEPSTQMTLNTFHFAGRGEMNVTLGIPRLREILMVASKCIKTPSMEIPFKMDISSLKKKAKKLRKSLTKITLKDVLEKIVVKEFIQLKNHTRNYVLQLHYLPKTCYSNETNLKPCDIVKFVETRFLVRLEMMLKKQLKSNYNSDLVDIDQGHAKYNKTEDDTNTEQIHNKKTEKDDSDDDSDIEGDGDATEVKFRNRQNDTLEYDDEDDNEIEKNIENNNDERLDKTVKSGVGDTNDSNSDSDSDNSSSFAEVSNITLVNKKKGSNITKIYGIKSVKHDPVNMLWSKIVLWSSLSYKRLDLFSLLPKEATVAVIHEVPGIKRAITYTNKEGVLMLKTEGSNSIGEFFKYDRLLNLNKLYSNDIQAIALTYGIETANRVLIKEVQDVFQMYGIKVDPRHLSLIADYMTFDGTYQPLNRTGMDNCPSPLQKMTFESSLKYLKNATVRKLKDNLQSPSSCLIVGQESKIGSGLIRLYCK